MKLSAHLLWLMISVTLTAQSSQTVGQNSAPVRSTLSGIVTKDPGSEPVKKALIELIAENQADGGDYTALTGPDGAFHIEGIVPGRYRLFAERTGYLEVDKHRPRSEGRVLTLTAGQEIKDLLIRLQAAAVVEGRVTDEDGDPLPNAQVAVLQQTFSAGRSHWEQSAGERTNDLGEYRISGLATGSYFISVTPPPDFKSLIEASSNAPTDSRNNASSPPSKDSHAAASSYPTITSYMTTFYPGTKDRGQATPIQLHAGDDFPANFSLTPSPSLIIRGSIANIPPSASAIVMLQSKDFNLVLIGAEIRKDGSFEIRDVSPGSYSIVATVSGSGEPMMARQTLQVASENIDGVRLTPQTGAWVHGHIRLESKSNAGKPDPTQLFLQLHSADGDDDFTSDVTLGEGFTNLAHVNADGSFEWKSVPAGRYYVQLAGEGNASPDWFLKSVSTGNRDSGEAGFTINGGTAVIDLVVSATGAVIDGIVASHKNEPMPNATVVLVPEVRLRQRSDRYRKTVTDQSGHFTLHGIPPGDYILFAWEVMDGEAYYNSDFQKLFEGQGKTLHISEGEHTNVPLEVILAPEEP